MKYMLMTGFIALALMSCTKSETQVETTENPDGSVSTTTIETEKRTALDSATVKASVENAREELNKAGETLKRAGEDVKDAAAKGTAKVEEGAEKVKEDLKKK